MRIRLYDDAGMLLFDEPAIWQGDGSWISGPYLPVAAHALIGDGSGAAPVEFREPKPVTLLIVRPPQLEVLS